jgi:putative salt-induced outer membrane protein YdiY
MKQFRFFVALTFALLCAVSMFADQIVLKNGDRLTGTITKSDDKTLVIKTEFAGDVTVQWPAVEQVTSSQQLHVAEKSGATVAGTVTTADNNLVVAPPSGATVNVAKADVTALRNDQEQAIFEKGEHPTLLQGWTGGATVGFGLTGGNSQTESLSLAFTADRPTKTDDIKMYANSVYSTNNAPGATPNVTANTIQAGARYSHNLTARLFAFGAGNFQTDALQYLNLRTIITGGLGVHIIKTDKTTLDFLTGPGYTHESYAGFYNATGTPPGQVAPVTNSFAIFTVGEEFTRKMRLGTLITEKFYYLPNLSHTGQYQTNFAVGSVTKISKWFGWQNAFSDIYVTNPPPSTKNNDLVFTTGLNIAFTH